MKPVNIFFLKIFTYVLITYGIGIYYFNLGTGEDRIIAFIIQVVLFSLLIATLITKWQKEALEALGITNIQLHHLKRVQRKIIRDSRDLDDIHKLIKEHTRFKHIELDQPNNLLIMKTSSSYESLGEIITVKKVHDHLTMESKPIFVLPIVDFAKSINNLTHLERILSPTSQAT